MAFFRVALLQLSSGKSLADNLKIGLSACRKAKEFGADLALFPEMWSTGYTFPERVEDLKKLAISAEGEFVAAFGKIASELHMAIGITLLESYEPLPRNTLVLFDRNGVKKLTYAKVHTCDFGEERNLTPGEDFYVTELDTASGPVQLGAMICYDREFPESARILMLKGAEIVLVPNACPMEINRLSQLRARAFENMIGIATCNYPEGTPDLPDSRDTCILEAGEQEGIYLAEFDLDQLRAYRKAEVHGNAYRHPRKYSLLTEEIIREPFIRSDYRS